MVCVRSCREREYVDCMLNVCKLCVYIHIGKSVECLSNDIYIYIYIYNDNMYVCIYIYIYIYIYINIYIYTSYAMLLSGIPWNIKFEMENSEFVQEEVNTH